MSATGWAMRRRLSDIGQRWRILRLALLLLEPGVDDRVSQDQAKVASALQPDHALGGHTASLGLAGCPLAHCGAFRWSWPGQHGSWNSSKLSGYKPAFVAFERGKPVGMPREVLADFLLPDEKYSYGRPVGVALTASGVLLMADNVGDVIWRVTGT